MSGAAQHEPEPTAGQIAVGEIVLRDIQERIDAGKAKYGTLLMTNNGRSALWDAYQEAIDLVMYLRQKILENDVQGTALEHPAMQCGSCGDQLVWDAERGYTHCGPHDARHEHIPWGTRYWSKR